MGGQEETELPTDLETESSTDIVIDEMVACSPTESPDPFCYSPEPFCCLKCGNPRHGTANCPIFGDAAKALPENDTCRSCCHHTRKGGLCNSKKFQRQERIVPIHTLIEPKHPENY